MHFTYNAFRELSIELDELRVERIAVALCPHTAWCPKLLDHVLVQEPSMPMDAVYTREPLFHIG